MAKKGVSVGVKITGSAKGFKSAAEDAKKATDELRKKAAANSREIERNFKQVTIAMAKITGAVLAAKEAFNIYSSVMDSTGIGSDKLAVILEQTKQGFDQLKRTVQTFDFKDFTKKLKAAINEGKRYADSLDEIDEKTRALKMAESDASDQIIKQRIIQNSALSTQKQKIAAGEKIIELEKELTVIRLGVADQAYKNELANISSITHLTEAEIEALLRGDQAMKDKLALGQNYNDQQSQLDALNKKSAMSRGQLEEADKKRRNELLVLMDKEKSATIERWAFASRMMVNDEKLNLAVEKYIELGEARRKGDEESIRVLSKLDTALSKVANTQINISKIGLSTKTLPALGNMPSLPGLRGAPQTSGLDFTKQIEMVQRLNSVFTDMFSSVDKGFKGMVDSIISSLTRLLAELAAKAVVFSILNMLSGGTGQMAAFAKGVTSKGFGSFLGLAEGGIVTRPTMAMVGEGKGPEAVIPLSKLPAMMGGQNVHVTVKGKFNGRDIFFAAENYQQLLNNNT
jgi:hypothetical protein